MTLLSFLPITASEIHRSYLARKGIVLTDTTLSTCKGVRRSREHGMRGYVPQKIHLSDFWSKMFCNVGSSVSAISVVLERGERNGWEMEKDTNGGECRTKGHERLLAHK